MPLRELTDRRGVAWKVWEITPDQLHPSTRSGDHLQGFRDGWLVFERLDGLEKRRLFPVPDGWPALSDARLEALCERAEPVRVSTARRQLADVGEGGSRSEPGDPGLADAPARPPARSATRTFLFPGGRVWTVAELVTHPRGRMGEPLESRTVLRFTSGVRSLDLGAWPSDWLDFSDERLAQLLAGAFPREAEGPASGVLHRRRTDVRG